MTLSTLPENVFDTLKAIGKEDDSTMNTLITLYREQAPEMIGTIKLNASEKDKLELKKSAHAFKGVCMNLGFTPLGTLCAGIEESCLHEDYIRIDALYTQLKDLHDKIVTKLLTQNLG